MKVKFNSSDTFIPLQTFIFKQHYAELYAPNLKWDLSGFEVYDDKDRLRFDGTHYVYQWNVITEKEGWVVLTDLENFKETPPDVDEEDETNLLSFDDLINLVGDLMFELDCMKLGLEV